MNYKVNLATRIKDLKSISVSGSDSWEKLKECVQEAASTALNRPTSPMTPRRRKACAKFEQLKFKLGRDPSNVTIKRELGIARKAKYEANQAHIADQCEDFFRNLVSHHPAEKVQKTFKFLNKFKRNAGQKQRKTFIPISTWQNDLKNACSERQVENIPGDRQHTNRQAPYTRGDRKLFKQNEE